MKLGTPGAVGQQDTSETIKTSHASLVSTSATARLAVVSDSPPGLTIAQRSHVGRVRQRNEDSLLVLDATYCGGTAPVTLSLCMVADGMGGHQNGDVASLLAVRVAAAHIVRDVVLPFMSGEGPTSQQPPINETLTKSVQAANEAVRRQVPNGGTTLTMALVLGHRVYLAHVGDSRAYVFTDGRLHPITQDHSLAARLAQTGQATREGALMHAPQNVLYRALGQANAVEVDIHMHPFVDGDCLLLCSDGLWGKVTDAEITDALKRAPSPHAAVEALVEAANERGGEDNITAILAVRNAS
jgi:serine/threonine protein phosphatase PrpC